MLQPVTELLMQKTGPELGMSILDIGCGCGATVLALAKSVGPEGRVMGVDVSARLVEIAKSCLSGYSNAEIVLADAATLPFEPFADLAISRFGVMFFGDPGAAFRNVRKAMKPGARLFFACWRDIAENPWMTVPLGAVQAAGIPPAPRPGPEDPGPFSFANPDRVRKILTSAGFGVIAMTPADLVLDIAGGGGLDAAVKQAMTIGAAAAALRDQPEDKAAAAKLVADALSPCLRDGTVTLGAAIWLVEARAS